MIEESEKIFVDKLEQRLNILGYKTWREVVPDECKNWELPFRIDLIFWHPIYGFIAVEAKNIRSLRQGSVFSKAIKQIIKYKDMEFFNGKKISKWCISVPQSIDSILCPDNRSDILREINLFIKGFIKNMYNISMLDFDNYGISIDSYTSDRIDIEKNSIQIQPPISFVDVKICPYCDLENDIEDTFCNRCMRTLREKY